MVQQVMEALGHRVERPTSSEHDRIIDGWKTEIKVSTTWNETLDNWTWQQIREQDYDRIIFVGINPNDVSIWWATKEDLRQFVLGRDEMRQHAGKDGGQELYWIQGSGVKPWFREMNSF